MSTATSRFAFGLQRVLDLREQREQAIAGRLGAARDAATEAREAMDALAAVRLASGAELAAAHGAAQPVASLHQRERVLESYDAHLDIAEREVAEREARVAHVRNELDVAMQSRRVISKLRERREEEWRLARVRTDRTQMDALAVDRHARNTPTDPTEAAS